MDYYYIRTSFIQNKDLPWFLTPPLLSPFIYIKDLPRWDSLKISLSSANLFPLLTSYGLRCLIKAVGLAD